MSAFIISDETLILLRSYLKHDKDLWHYACLNIDNLPPLDEFMQLILNENYQSVNYRYKEEGKAPKIALRDCPPPDAITCYKLIQCIDYQCCEHDAWQYSIAKKALDYIQRSIANEIISKLPAYKSAPWDASEKDIPAGILLSGLMRSRS